MPPRIRPKTPVKKTAENDAFAMYVCRQCGQVVTPLDSKLPCPGCGGLAYRRSSMDIVGGPTEQPC